MDYLQGFLVVSIIFTLVTISALAVQAFNGKGVQQ